MIKILTNFVWENKGQIARFSVVGASSAVIDFGLLYILTDIFGLYYLLSATISFIAAATYNFSLNRKWTFKSKGDRRRQLPIFFGVAIVGVLLNLGIMYLGVDYLGVHYMLAKVLATGVVTIYNFLGNKYVTFRKIKSKEESDSIGMADK